MFGDEIGIFWNTPPKILRPSAKRGFEFDASRITIESDWRLPDEWPELHGPTAIDVETHDPGLSDSGIGPSWAFAGEGKIVGVCVANADRQWYFPTQHESGENLPHSSVMGWLGEQLAKPEVEPIFANAPYDVGWLTVREGLKIAGPIHDVQIQMTLLDEHRFEYSLDSLGRDLFGLGKDDALLRRAIEQATSQPNLKDKYVKQLLWRAPGRYAAPYGERDARLTYDVWKVLSKQIEDEKLQRIYALEQSMIRISVGMRAHGIRVDLDRAEQVGRDLQRKETELIDAVKRRTGVAIDPWVSESIARAFRAEGVSTPRTAAGKDSVTKEWLEKQPGTLGHEIRQIRVYNKARTTFIDGHVKRHTRCGRIHCEFHQLRGESDDGGGRGTITGRFSCSNPNLQQIPKRNKEILKLVRTLFLADEGHKWAALDYSSQEPRLIVHFASILNPPIAGAAEARQRYLDNPRTDYHQMVADFCGIEREQAKPINLGIGYGMGGAKLCRELKLPTEWCLVANGKWTVVDPEEIEPAARHELVEVAGPEGKELIQKYHNGAPFIKGMIETCQRRGKHRGYIITLLGRKGRFPDVNGERLGAHAALNKLAQGSAADQTKEAMRILYEEHNVMPLLTMHDELGLSVPDYKDARFAADVMELAVQLQVPSIVDVKMGESWGSVVDADPTPSMGRGTTARHCFGLD